MSSSRAFALAEARRDRLDARDDIAEEGAPVVVRWDRSYLVTGGRRGPEDLVEVATHALLHTWSAREDPSGRHENSVKVILADAGLGVVVGLPGMKIGSTGVSGYSVLFDDRGLPVATGTTPGGHVRLLKVTALVDITGPAGVRILYTLEARES